MLSDFNPSSFNIGNCHPEHIQSSSTLFPFLFPPSCFLLVATNVLPPFLHLLECHIGCFLWTSIAQALVALNSIHPSTPSPQKLESGIPLPVNALSIACQWNPFLSLPWNSERSPPSIFLLKMSPPSRSWSPVPSRDRILNPPSSVSPIRRRLSSAERSVWRALPHQV